MITLVSEQCHCAVYKMYELLERCETQVPYSRFVKGCWYGHNCSEHVAKSQARARQCKNAQELACISASGRSYFMSFLVNHLSLEVRVKKASKPFC